MKEINRCGRCRFWKVWTNKHDEPDGTGLGWCRRYPPNIPNDSLVTIIERPGDNPSAAFPTTGEDEWCGEWVRRGKP